MFLTSKHFQTSMIFKSSAIAKWGMCDSSYLKTMQLLDHVKSLARVYNVDYLQRASVKKKKNVL